MPIYNLIPRLRSFKLRLNQGNNVKIRFAFAVLAVFAVINTANADIIDTFVAQQGPFTVAPGEQISPDDAVLITPTVLGGFRVLTPVINDEAVDDSSVTAASAGGVFTCDFRFPFADTERNQGGCSFGYDRGNNEFFDLTGSTAFEFDVLASEGDLILAVELVGDNSALAIGFVENPKPGLVRIPFDEIFPATAAPVDFSAVDNIAFVMINPESDSALLRIGEVRTDGPIGTDDPASTEETPPDEELSEEIPGSFFDPIRSGEGCQLTREADDETFIFTCYIYQNGGQAWLIGNSELQDGRVIIDQMSITDGTDFGPDFDRDDVNVRDWGSAELQMLDCNNMRVSLMPQLPGFEAIDLFLTKLVPTACGSGGVTPANASVAGNWFDEARSGEGFQIAAEGADGNLQVLTWYTYLNGEQVWMIGTGERNGSQTVFSDVQITEGADYGADFDRADVMLTPFGTITFDFSDCNNAAVEVRPELAEFEDIDLNVTKIVPGSCP